MPQILQCALKSTSMSSAILPILPQFLQGEVVKGFGRGSKQLGCPTANYNIEVVKSLPRDLDPGVYYGWAQVDSGPVYKMVTNIGWCPFYQNKEMSVVLHAVTNVVLVDLSVPVGNKVLSVPACSILKQYTYCKTMHFKLYTTQLNFIQETHVIHKFDDDFYGSQLKIAIVGYLRGEKNFSSLNELIEAIKQDIENGAKLLEEPHAKEIQNHSFFIES